MKLSVTQPYFFPYLGIFQLIYHTDFMVILDMVKFKKQSWMIRNRILHQTNDFNYIKLPTKKYADYTLIKDVEIFDNINWKDKILALITLYANKAPYYTEVRKLLEECFFIEEKSYCILSTKFIEIICNYLEITFSYQYLSQMQLSLPKINKAGEWSLHIAHALDAKEYVNMPSGSKIFAEDEFSKRNIKLSFLEPKLRKYEQKKDQFISHLSILDVLMWNSKEEVLSMIRNDFEIVTKNDLLKEQNQ